MTMTDQEKAIVKKFVDEQLPAIVVAEEERLPVYYKGLVSMVVSALMPALIAALDAKLASAAPQAGV